MRDNKKTIAKTRVFSNPSRPWTPQHPPAIADQTMSQIKTTRLGELEKCERIVRHIEEMLKNGRSDNDIIDYVGMLLG